MPTPSPALRAGLPIVGLVALLVVLGLSPPGADLPPGPPDDQPAVGLLDPARLTGPDPVPFEQPALPSDDEDGAVVVVRGSGWGHSVGMSQYGAQAQALAGRSYRDILAHYYPGTAVERHAATDRGIRVGLFRNRDVDDPQRLLVETAGHAGAPDRPVEIRIGDEVVAVPFGQTWSLTVHDEGLALHDDDGELQATGPAPAQVWYGFLDGAPTLLRLPQLAELLSESATLQWGYVEVDVSDEEVRPTLVVPLELYLRGLAEMPASWEAEALKAQALAGRTYAVRMVLDDVKDDCGCHLGTTPHDQAYAGWAKERGRFAERWTSAVRATEGEVVLYDGELAWTYYSSSHGGRTEAAPDSWAYDEEQRLPYLVSVDDPWSLSSTVDNPRASWEREIPATAFARAVGLVELEAVTIGERTDGGSPAALSVSGIDFAGNAVAYDFRGWRTGIAASDLKLTFGALLPSQQLTTIEVREPPPDPDRTAEPSD